MKDLAELLRSKDVPKEFFKHPRHKIIDAVWQRVNYDREQAGYKPLPKSFFGMKLAPIPLDDQFYLLKKMSQSPYPGKVFFGLLKVKKDENEPPVSGKQEIHHTA